MICITLYVSARLANSFGTYACYIGRVWSVHGIIVSRKSPVADCHVVCHKSCMDYARTEPAPPPWVVGCLLPELWHGLTPVVDAAWFTHFLWQCIAMVSAAHWRCWEWVHVYRRYFSARLHGITAHIVTAVKTWILTYRTCVLYGCLGLNERVDVICCPRTDLCVCWLSIAIGEQGRPVRGFSEN